VGEQLVYGLNGDLIWVIGACLLRGWHFEDTLINELNKVLLNLGTDEELDSLSTPLVHSVVRKHA
jgi:HD-like signal output (HDOD) protein